MFRSKKISHHPNGDGSSLARDMNPVMCRVAHKSSAVESFPILILMIVKTVSE